MINGCDNEKNRMKNDLIYKYLLYIKVQREVLQISQLYIYCECWWYLQGWKLYLIN